MATSEVSICNLALQKNGSGRIVSLTEDSPQARECNACYEAMRDLELRKHRWAFAIKRAALAADATAPAFGPVNYFTLPSDFLRLLEPDEATNFNTLDWRIESNAVGAKAIATNDSAPLEIRYVWRVVDPTVFDAAFVEALACRIASQTCEKLTQSNAKKAGVQEEYKDAIREARRTNAIEGVSAESPIDTWITARL